MTKWFYLVNVCDILLIVNMLKGANLKGGGGAPAATGAETIVDDGGVSPADLGVNLSLFAAQTASSRYPRSMS